MPTSAPAPARPAGGRASTARSSAGGGGGQGAPAAAAPAAAAPAPAVQESLGEPLPAETTTSAPAAEPAAKPDKSGIDTALDFFADKANLIPGFRMFTIILGVNPINFSRVDRSTANILRAVLELIPMGVVITQALENSGIFERAGAWVDKQIRTLGISARMIQQAIYTFLDSLSLIDIFRPVSVWNRAVRIFSDPIDRIIDFAKGLATQILQFIRQAILLPLARLAEGTDGYDLLKAVLGQDPITGQPVPRNAETLVGGFLKLIGKQELWENIKKARAIPRIWAWFQGALSTLVGFVRQIPGLFMAALRALQVVDMIVVPRAFAKLVGVFGGFIVRFVAWAGNAVWKLLEIVFEALAPKAIPYLKKAAGAFRSILNNPIGFVGNLVKAGKLGFQKFSDNILTHLKTGLIDWLTGSLEGVYIPKALSLLEVGKFVLSVLGVSWAQIRGKIVKALGPSGETIMKVLETTFDIVVALVRGGPAAAWEVIKEKLTDLKDMVVQGIIGFVTDTIVKKAIPKLIAMFIPGAGFVSAIISIYDTIMVFIEKISKIIQVVTAFLDSIMAIASGQVEGAAKKVESVLAGLLSLAISFLAGFLGLGKITDKIKEIIAKVREKVDKALDKAIEFIVSKAKALFAKGKAAVAAVIDWLREKAIFTNSAGEMHEISIAGTESSPELMIASNKGPIGKYLNEYEPKTSPEYKIAMSVFDGSSKVLYSFGRLAPKEKEARKGLIKTELAKISAAFAKLAGKPPIPADYKDAEVVPSGPPARKNLVKYLSGNAKGGTPPQNRGPNSNTPGWGRVLNSGLTTQSDKWVQMHVISEKLGGKGDGSNLISAPNSINTGYFRSFEHGVVALAKATSQKVKNVVWVVVTIDWWSGNEFAKKITGKAGLYFWTGKKANAKEPWVQNTQPSLTAEASIPRPDLHEKGKYSLNFSSKTDLRTVIKDEALVNLIHRNRPYSSIQDFEKRITDEANRVGISQATNKIAGILGNSNIILKDK